MILISQKPSYPIFHHNDNVKTTIKLICWTPFSSHLPLLARPSLPKNSGNSSFTLGLEALEVSHITNRSHVSGTSAIVNRTRKRPFFCVTLHTIGRCLSLSDSEYAGLRRIRTRLQCIVHPVHCAFPFASLPTRHYYHRMPVENAL